MRCKNHSLYLLAMAATVMTSTSSAAAQQATVTRPAVPSADPSRGPGGLHFHGVAFDSARGMLLVFGGQNAADEPTNALWGWDGSAWRLLANDGPHARMEPVLAYDARRARTVMLGGAVDGGRFFDTWEWDGSRWHRITPNGPALGHPAWTYDPVRGRVVVHGGSRRLDPGREGQVMSRVTWEYDGQRWVKRDTVGPPERSAHAMAFDPTRGAILMTGGSAGPGAQREDTWSWDGTTWRLLATDGPPGRNGHALAPAGDAGVLLFGGWSELGAHDATWLWADGRWTRVDAAGPPARAMGAMAWDPIRRRVLLYGGTGVSGVLNDLWEFDPRSRRWTEVWKPAVPPRD
jgi:hypothetical protein